jgi:hypothetical protein
MKFLKKIENGANFTFDKGINKDVKENKEESEENGMKKNINYSKIVHRNSLVGTAEYASPEMLNNEVYSHITNDLWALGCIIYKFLHGKTPFKGSNEEVIFNNILNFKISISKDIPECAQDLLRKILIDCPKQRLGAGKPGSNNDINALKKHEFFKGINFEELHLKKPPLKINNLDRFKSSENIRSFISPKLTNINNEDNEITNSNNFYSTFIQNSASTSNSPNLNKFKKCSSYLIENDFSMREFSFELYSALQDQDIIEDYLFKFDDMKINSREMEVIHEGVIDKKAWVFFSSIKLKLYSNGKLEIWNIKKNILNVNFK